MSPVIISWIALVVSVCALAWNVLAHFLTAARVRVSWRPAAVTPDMVTRSPALAGKRAPVGPAGVDLSIPRYHVEAFDIRVENIGRTAVTIIEPMVDIYPARWRRRLNKIPFLANSHDVSTALLDFRDYATEPRRRLEPLDEVSFLMLAPPIIEGAGRIGRRQWLRPAVRVAGRRAAILSAWRDALRVDPGSRCLRGDCDDAPDVVAYAVTYMGREDRAVLAHMTARIVKRHFDGGEPDAERLREELEDKLEQYDHLGGMLARYELIDILMGRRYFTGKPHEKAPAERHPDD